MRLLVHVVLFVVVGAAIVTMGAFYTERQDSAAWRSLPKRLAFFLLGCAILAGVMLLLEHTVGSID
jgi:NADH:ubiquinone oxidoreductase subunit 5 (subunit L)/multisubunit Na+/H+ antiporter MnhA subunit